MSLNVFFIENALPHWVYVMYLCALLCIRHWDSVVYICCLVFDVITDKSNSFWFVFLHKRHGRKEGGGCCASFADSWDHVFGDEVYFHTTLPVRCSVLHRYRWRIHRPRMLTPIRGMHWCKHTRTMFCLLPHQMASSSIQPFGHNGHGPKLGGSPCALFLGVARSLSNTTSPGPTRGLFPYQAAS